MHPEISYEDLDSDAKWIALSNWIDESDKNQCVKGLIDGLKDNGVTGVIIEENYLDPDFSASYGRFYSQVFKRHSKVCKRLHFFCKPVSDVFSTSSPIEISKKLDSLNSTGMYVGFFVVRPLKHAPIGRTVIQLPSGTHEKDIKTHLLVHANHEVHLLGSSLNVKGFALIQQDTRVGACAQASIWMAGHHLHIRHKYPSFNTIEITDSATKITDELLSSTLPAGSEFLTPRSMVQALKEMGRYPLTYQASRSQGANGHIQLTWNLRAKDIINRYVDSGIPVILGLTGLNSGQAGHAVVATGHVMKERDSSHVLPTMPTRAEFLDYFLVNDDQRGANLRLPIKKGAPLAQHEHFIEGGNASGYEGSLMTIIIPLPNKVFLPAESAERVAWNDIYLYTHNWDAIKKHYGTKIDDAVARGDELTTAISNNKIIARTYLTYGWKYKARAIQNGLSDEFKALVFYSDLPKYVWVTEFGTYDSLNHLDVKNRSILAHTVVDATASKHWRSLLVFHAPGLAKTYQHDPDDNFADYVEKVIPLKNEETYFPKLRGSSDFSEYA